MNFSSMGVGAPLGDDRVQICFRTRQVYIVQMLAFLCCSSRPVDGGRGSLLVAVLAGCFERCIYGFLSESLIVLDQRCRRLGSSSCFLDDPVEIVAFRVHVVFSASRKVTSSHIHRMRSGSQSNNYHDITNFRKRTCCQS